MSEADPNYSNNRFKACVDSYPGWQVMVYDDDGLEVEITSPTGNIFTSMSVFADELQSDNSEFEPIDPQERDIYSAELGYSELIWDCIRNVRTSGQ